MKKEGKKKTNKAAFQEHCYGLTIFGRNFGNYNQGIKVRIAYSPIHGQGEEKAE